MSRSRAGAKPARQPSRQGARRRPATGARLLGHREARRRHRPSRSRRPTIPTAMITSLGSAAAPRSRDRRRALLRRRVREGRRARDRARRGERLVGDRNRRRRSRTGPAALAFTSHVRHRRFGRPPGREHRRRAVGDRHPHGGRARPPRPRRRRRLGRAGGRRRARVPPALDHRPLAGRAPADGLGRAGATCSCFNGEIYNYLELRAELERAGVAFRGHSDTEVMLGRVRALGPRRRRSRRFDGMFAFALWDRRERVAAPRARPHRREAALLRHRSATRSCSARS